MKLKFLKKLCILIGMTLLLAACGETAGQNETAASLSDEAATSAVREESTEVTSAPAVQDEMETSSDPTAREETETASAPAVQDETEAVSGSVVQEETVIVPAPEGEIIVANLRGEDSFFSERVTTFSRENPVYGIEYQAAYQEEEADRLLLETANGNGPDILFLTRQDMESLQTQGILGDLGQLISQDTLEVLLPGVLQMGTYDEELVAVPLSVAVITLVTSRDYWQEDSWTTEDILSIMQDQSEPSGLFLDITGQDTYDYNMYYLIGMDIGNSPFIKDGNCRFDSEEFRELLTLVKEMTQKANNSSSPTNRFTPLIEGEYLGIGYYMYNMKALCDIYDKMGDNANLVGYPSDTGSCQYLSDYGVLVVNHTAMEKAGVKELVNYLLSLESQQMLSYEISVRLDIPESQVVYNSAGNNYFWQFIWRNIWNSWKALCRQLLVPMISLILLWKRQMAIFREIRIWIPLLTLFKDGCSSIWMSGNNRKPSASGQAASSAVLYLFLGSFCIFFLTVFAAVDLFCRISQIEDVGQFLFDGGDAAGVVAVDHVFDLLGQHQILFVNDLPVLNYIDGDVVVDICQNVQIQHVDVAFHLQNIFFAHFFTAGIFDDGHGTVQLVQSQMLIDGQAFAGLDMI